MAFTDDEKRRITAMWMRATCDQATFAAEHGVSPRALRTWVAKYSGGSRPEARARAVIEKAIEDLRALLAGLDADTERQAGTGEAGDPEMPVRQAASELGSVRVGPVTAPRPMPRGFFSGF